MTCPRCKRDLPLHYFAGISLCLPCYSNIPANRGLSLGELRIKAHRSRKARYSAHEYLHRDDIERLLEIEENEKGGATLESIETILERAGRNQ